MTALWGVGQIRMGTLLSNALYLPGTPHPLLNYASTPDPGSTFNGDIDLRWWGAPADWTPAASQALIAQVSSGGGIAWQWFIEPSGEMLFFFTPDGSSGGPAYSGAATGFADGTDHWMRVTRQVSTGIVKHYTSPDGSSWTQLGSDSSPFGGGVPIFPSTVPITIGARGDGGTPFEGIVRYAELRDGINGTVIYSFDAAAVTKLGTRNPYTVSAGGPWTITGTGWDWVQA